MKPLKSRTSWPSMGSFQVQSQLFCDCELLAVSEGGWFDLGARVRSYDVSQGWLEKAKAEATAR